MSSLNLTNIQYFTPDTNTNIANANFIAPPNMELQTAQKLAVRQLLALLLSYLSIYDTLSENQYPYQLQHSKKFVCFTHSQNAIGVALHDAHPIGIDIEYRHITTFVAQRFFHPNENNKLKSLANQTALFKIYQILWQAKEAMIKIQQTNLTHGLHYDFSSIIDQLIDYLNKSIDYQDNKIKPNAQLVIKINHQFSLWLNAQHTVVIFRHNNDTNTTN